jgi:hypothetical protein
MDNMITPEEFKSTMRKICDAKTSAHPDQWTSQDPFLGHCTVVALVAQDVFGGDILRVDLRTVPGFEEIKWHSWNKMPSGEEIDFANPELKDRLPKSVPVEVRTRENLFSYPTIQKRYELLKSRFDANISLA